MRIEHLNEKAPKGKKAKRFIRKAKQDFKDRYGDAWKQVLYATAWKMFGESVDLVEMEAPADFGAWFANSKCVDDHGRPLVMYHGVPAIYAGFDRFSDNPMGHYFTSDASYAQSYAEKPIDQWGDGSYEDSGAIYPVYLSLRNPIIVDEHDEEAVSNYSHHHHTAASLKASGHDGMMIRYADGEVEAMVISSDQIVSTLAVQLDRQRLSEDVSPIRKMIDEYRKFKGAPNCYMDFMPGDLPNEVEIDSLSVDPHARHQGQGRKAMTEICRLADQHDVILTLLPVPNTEEGETMDFRDLADFYKRFGFDWGTDDDVGPRMMIRFPANSKGRLDEGLIAIPTNVLDRLEFLLTFHYLWWAKARLKASKLDLPAVKASLAAEEQKLGEEIPDRPYAVPQDMSVTKIAISVKDLPEQYQSLPAKAESFRFVIMWGDGFKSVGGWVAKHKSLVISPESLDYIKNWPNARSSPQELSIGLSALKSTLKHELRHMIQDFFLGEHPEQNKYKPDYNAHGTDYFTSPIEFDPMIGTMVDGFFELWSHYTRKDEPIPFEKAVAQFTGARDAPMGSIFSAPRFFVELKKNAPTRWRRAAKKFMSAVIRDMENERISTIHTT